MSRMTVQRGTAQMGLDPGRIRDVTAQPQRNFVSYAEVGHWDDTLGVPEPNPQYARIEQGQAWIECTLRPDGDQIVARLALPSAEDGAGWYIPLQIGARVVVEMVKGNPQTAVITGRMWDATYRIPDVVAGVQTGAVGAQVARVGVPAPLWQFIMTPVGQLLAIETGAGGDVLIHTGAGGGVHVKADSPQAVHVEGITHLGSGPTTPPVGATVGPAGAQVPGTPMVPRPPVLVPHVPPVAPPGPINPPFVGDRDAIVRVKDAVQSDATIDPTFWTWLAAVDVLLKTIGLAAPTPVGLTSDHRSGSQHTASD